ATATFTNVTIAPTLTDADIGSPSPAGSGSFNASTGTFTVVGGGADIFGTSDQFNFDSMSYTGDGVAIAKVASITNTNAWAKAGVMFRDSSAANAPEVAVVVTPSQGVSFQWRATTGGTTTQTQVTGITAPEWVKLARFGNAFTAYYSSDGNTWTQIGTAQTI